MLKISHQAEQKLKSPQKLAEESMSKVQKLNRAMQSGRLKMELRTVPEAIHSARALYKQIESAGLQHKDFSVHIAYMTPDLSALFTHQYVLGEEAKIQAELSGPGMCCILVGLGFAMRDWDRKNWVVGVRPFLDTPLVHMAFNQWLEEMLITNS
jgi:hypothetical protein